MKHAPLLILISLLLTACAGQQVYTGMLVVDGEQTLPVGETLAGELVVTGGQVSIPASARIAGSLLVLGGEVRLDGTVAGNTVLILGSLDIGPTAVIQGDLVSGPGDLQRDPAATVLGQESQEGAQLFDLRGAGQRSLLNRLVGLLLEAPLLALFGYLVTRYLPRQVSHLGGALLRHTLVSAALGLLAWVVGISLVVLMAFTLLLIPVSLLGFGVLLVGSVYGSIPLGLRLGSWLASRISSRAVSKPAAAALGMALLAAGIEFVPLIPLIGDWIGIFVIVAGLGAAFLTRFGLVPFIPLQDSLD